MTNGFVCVPVVRTAENLQLPATVHHFSCGEVHRTQGCVRVFRERAGGTDVTAFN